MPFRIWSHASRTLKKKSLTINICTPWLAQMHKNKSSEVEIELHQSTKWWGGYHEPSVAGVTDSKLILMRGPPKKAKKKGGHEWRAEWDKVDRIRTERPSAATHMKARTETITCRRTRVHSFNWAPSPQEVVGLLPSCLPSNSLGSNFERISQGQARTRRSGG